MNMNKLITFAAVAASVAIPMAANAADVYTYTDGNGVEWAYTIVSGTNVRLGQSTALTGSFVDQEIKAISADITVDASTIPWTFTNNGTDYTVTEIAAAAFATRVNLIGTLCFPATVKTVGERAFQGCHGLTALTSLGGVTRLHHYTFNECKNLSGVFPDVAGVSTFGSGPFQMAGQNGGMTGTVRFNKNLTTVPKRMFNATCLSGTILIPSSVTYVGDTVFNEAKYLKGVWIAGVPYATSGDQAYTTIDVNNVFRYNFANELVVIGPNTTPNGTLTSQWQNFGRDVHGEVLLPDNGKWDGFTLNSANASVVYYGFKMELDEDAGIVKITATTAEQLKQALEYAPQFKNVFGYDMRINVTNTLDLSGVTITEDMVSGVTFDRLIFSAKTQTQMDAILAAVPSSVPVSIDPTGLTENMTIPDDYPNVFVKTVPGVTIKRTTKGFMIIVK